MQTVPSSPGRRLAVLCAAGVLALATTLPPVASATDIETAGFEPAAATTVAPDRLTEEGRRLLLATLSVAGLLVGVERIASWRLGVRQCREFAAARELESALPPLDLRRRPEISLATWQARMFPGGSSFKPARRWGPGASRSRA